MSNKSCEICASEHKVEKHRIIPGLKYGGKYTPENIILLCRLCHNTLHKIVNQVKREGRLEQFEWKDFVTATKNIRMGVE